ncbi:MAG: mRNA surveillance protein pelota [Candidatus Woesearchaeota archaeon]
MKIINKDLKHGLIRIKADDAQDLWSIEGIIEPGDLISGMTERKIKIGGSEEKSKVTRITIFLKIRAEKIEYDNTLRVSGPIIDGPEDVARGDYHTFSIEDGTIITIEKEKWSRYALKKLDDAMNSDKMNVLLVAFDREEAIFALLKNNGYETLLLLKGDVAKKGVDEKKPSFYKEIIQKMSDYDIKYSFDNIVLASPAFWKEYLLKELNNDTLRKKITLATCSSIDEGTINEILARPELKTVLEKDRSAKENALIEELLGEIRKDNAAYGLKDVESKISAGNISVFLITENFIKKSRANNTYPQIELLMERSESLNAEIRILNSEDASKKLDGLSGIACLFRWKENYE